MRARSHIGLGSCFLGLLLLMMPAAASGQEGGPLLLEEVVSKIKSSRLADLNQEIQKRGVSFVLTDGVKSQLQKQVNDFRRGDDQGYEEMLRTIREKEPTELVVAIAKFQNENEDNAAQLRNAIEAGLKTLQAPPNLLRIVPISVADTPIRDGEAFKIGDELGVHLVIWGDWRSKPDGGTVFHPRISVVHESRKTPIKRGTTEERPYKLDLAGSSGLNIIESGALKTSNLITLVIALSYYQKADYKNAAQLFASVPEADSEVYFYRGNCSYYLGEKEEAETYFKKAIELDKSSLKATHNLGVVQDELDEPEEAIESFKQALSLDPKSDKTLNNLGIMLAKEGDVEAGLAYLVKATTINPRSDNAWYNLGALIVNTGTNTPKAIEVFKRHLDMHPEDVETWLLCMDLLIRTLARREPERSEGEEAANKLLLTAIAKNPGNEKLLQVYVDSIPIDFTREELDRDQGYIESLAKAVSSPSSSKNAIRNKLIARTILVQVHLGNLEQARAAVAVIVIDPKDMKSCAQLTYQLALGALVKLDASPFARRFYTTTFEYFVQLHFFESALGENTKIWFDEYNALLKLRPLDQGTLIAKATLQTHILHLNDRTWVAYGFMKKDADINEWVGNFTSDARNTLEKALARTRDPRIRRWLQECEKELEDAWPP